MFSFGVWGMGSRKYRGFLSVFLDENGDSFPNIIGKVFWRQVFITNSGRETRLSANNTLFTYNYGNNG